MEILWAPWRMKYIEYTVIEKEKTCFICDAVKSKNLKENFVIFKGQHTVLLMNKYPYNTGHLLLSPIKHVGSLDQLTKEELCSLNIMLKNTINMLKKALNPDGFNIGINLGRTAGAGLEDHLHIHIVPRWNGDTNFMPVISYTKVIPESLNDTYKKLIKYQHILSEED